LTKLSSKLTLKVVIMLVVRECFLDISFLRSGLMFLNSLIEKFPTKLG